MLLLHENHKFDFRALQTFIDNAQKVHYLNLVQNDNCS